MFTNQPKEWTRRKGTKEKRKKKQKEGGKMFSGGSGGGKSVRPVTPRKHVHNRTACDSTLGYFLSISGKGKLASRDMNRNNSRICVLEGKPKIEATLWLILSIINVDGYDDDAKISNCDCAISNCDCAISYCDCAISYCEHAFFVLSRPLSILISLFVFIAE
jgi:hypothetical protein